MLKKGGTYANLKESWIVFICRGDPFNDGLPKYTVKPVCIENQKHVEDRTNKVFFNTKAFKKADDRQLKALLEYIETGVQNSKLTENIESALETSKGKEFMTFEEIIQEGKKLSFDDGVSKGREEGIKQTPLTLLKMSLPVEKIAEATKLSVEEIRQLNANN